MSKLTDADSPAPPIGASPALFTFGELIARTPGRSEPDRAAIFNALPAPLRRQAEDHAAGSCTRVEMIEPTAGSELLELEAQARKIAMDWLIERASIRAHPRPIRAPQARSTANRDDVLRNIAPADYIEALAGAAVPANGMICCPLPGHEDGWPSFRVYSDAERGFYCFGCNRGGDIFAFAGALWNLSPRTHFRELRRAIAEALLRSAA